MNEIKLAQLRKEALTSIELRPDMKDVAVNAYLADLTKQIKKERTGCISVGEMSFHTVGNGFLRCIR